VNPLLRLYASAYQQVGRPWLFRQSAQDAHDSLVRWLARADTSPALLEICRAGRAFSREQPVSAGGVLLPSPVIIAAGLVKGAGFPDEDSACQAVSRGDNIIPGWRSLPLLAGPVEFGSFTRWPRTGNSGAVVWRDAPASGLQNRIGLKNPGARAAAAFLNLHQDALPPCFGINIAVSPGVEDAEQETQEVIECVELFRSANLSPTWFTLNLSCPNTEDDPLGNQSGSKAARLAQALRPLLDSAARAIPLWIKIGPDLSASQLEAIWEACISNGVSAIVATNTLGKPAPDGSGLTAGISGHPLYPHALLTVQELSKLRQASGDSIDLIGCGGILTGVDAAAFVAHGCAALQIWSALVYRGPLAAGLIAQELETAS
jgi:dihydroorotate dehydrogenase